MTVPDIVTNITAFGAFVDIGVKQDGLVHVSQLSNRYVSDPKEVVKLNQKVTVTVTEVDVTRKRIALTMKTEARGQKLEVGGSRLEVRNSSSDKKQLEKKPQPLNSFQKSLLDLKKKFDG